MVCFLVMASYWGRTKGVIRNHIPLGQEPQTVHNPLSIPTQGWGWWNERQKEDMTDKANEQTRGIGGSDIWDMSGRGRVQTPWHPDLGASP